MPSRALIKMERDKNTNGLLDQIDSNIEVITDRIRDTIEIEGEILPKDELVGKVRQLHGRSRKPGRRKKPS